MRNLRSITSIVVILGFALFSRMSQGFGPNFAYWHIFGGSGEIKIVRGADIDHNSTETQTLLATIGRAKTLTYTIENRGSSPVAFTANSVSITNQVGVSVSVSRNIAAGSLKADNSYVPAGGYPGEVKLGTAEAWYRARNIVGADVVGGILVNDADINTWTDSNNSHDMTPVIGKPQYKTSGINGKPSVYFNRLEDDDLKATTGADDTANAPHTIITVVDLPTSWSDGNGGFIWYGGTGCTGCNSVLGAKNNTEYWIGGYGQNTGSGDLLNAVTPSRFVLTKVYTGSQVKGYVNGVLVDTQSLTYDLSDTTMGMGRHWDFNNTEMTFNMAETAVFHESMSDSDRQNIDCYFSMEYDLSISGCPATGLTFDIDITPSALAYSFDIEVTNPTGDNPYIIHVSGTANPHLMALRNEIDKPHTSTDNYTDFYVTQSQSITYTVENRSVSQGIVFPSNPVSITGATNATVSVIQQIPAGTLNGSPAQGPNFFVDDFNRPNGAIENGYDQFLSGGGAGGPAISSNQVCHGSSIATSSGNGMYRPTQLTSGVKFALEITPKTSSWPFYSQIALETDSPTATPLPNNGYVFRPMWNQIDRIVAGSATQIYDGANTLVNQVHKLIIDPTIGGGDIQFTLEVDGVEIFTFTDTDASAMTGPFYPGVYTYSSGGNSTCYDDFKISEYHPWVSFILSVTPTGDPFSFTINIDNDIVGADPYLINVSGNATDFATVMASAEAYYVGDDIIGADVSGGLVDGNDMLTWQDSNNSHDMTPVIGSPTYVANAFNGHAGVAFNSAQDDDLKTTTGADTAANAPHTIVIVAGTPTSLSTTYNGYFWYGGTGGSGTNSMIGANSSYQALFGGWGQATSSGDDLRNYQSPHILTKVYDGTKVIGYLNGIKIDEQSSFNYDLNDTAMGMGRHYDATGTEMSFVMAETAVFHESLSNNKRKLIECSLGTKYGVAVPNCDADVVLSQTCIDARTGSPPPGFDRIWTGAVDKNWSTATNWVDASGAATTVPGASNNVYVCGGLGNRPELSADVSVADITVNDNAFIVSPGRTLTASGDIDILKMIGGKIRANSGGAQNIKIAGGSADLEVTGASTVATLTANSTINNLIVSSSGTLDIASYTLTLLGDATITADLDMTNAAGKVVINGDFTISAGSSNLSAGVIELKGNFTIPYAYQVFRPSGTHKFLFNGTSPQTISKAYTIDRGNYFNDVEFDNASGIIIDPSVTGGPDAKGDFWAKGNVTLTNGNITKGAGTGDLWARIEGDLNDSGHHWRTGHTAYVYDRLDLYKTNGAVPSEITTRVRFYAANNTISGMTVHGHFECDGAAAVLTLAGTVTVDNDVNLHTGCEINFNGQTINVAGNFDSSGKITMTNAADLLDVEGEFKQDWDATNGGSTLTAGLIRVAGNFTVDNGTNIFQASGTHKVLLDGTAAQTFWMIIPSFRNNYLNDLEFNNTSGVVIHRNGSGSSDSYTDIRVNGTLTLTNGTVTSGIGAGQFWAHLEGNIIDAGHKWQPGGRTDLYKATPFIYPAQLTTDVWFNNNTTLTAPLTIHGEMRTYSATALLTISTTVNVDSHVYIQGSTGITIGAGTLNVGGNFDQAGLITMNNASGKIDVVGDYTTDAFASNLSSLTAGIIESDGDFIVDYSADKFKASGTHKVVLGGNGATVYMTGANAVNNYLNSLEIKSGASINISNVFSYELVQKEGTLDIYGEINVAASSFLQFDNVTVNLYDGSKLNYPDNVTWIGNGSTHCIRESEAAPCPFEDFEPTDITNLGLWLDITDRTKLFYDNGCSSLIAGADGDTVGCWQDKSGNNNHALTNVSQEPTYTGAGLDFNASSSNFFEINDHASISGTDIFVAIVFTTDSTSGTKYLMAKDGGGAGDTEYRLSHAGTTPTVEACDDSSTACDSATASAIGAGENHILTLFHQDSTQDTHIYLDGVYVNTENNGYTIADGGAALEIGTRMGADYFDGRISEVILYTKDLSTTEINNVHNYLKKKWFPINPCASGYSTPLALSISGLKLWLDGDDPANILDASNNDANSGSFSGTVASWRDKSGNCVNATQTTPSKEPSYNASAINSKGAVVGTGTQGMIFANDSVLSASSNYSIFYAYEPTTLGGYDTVLGFGGGGDAPLIGSVGSNVCYWSSHCGVGALSTGVTEYLSFTMNSGTVSGYVNTATAFSGAGTAISSGARYLMNDAGSEAVQGKLAEVVVFDRALTGPEKSDVEGYLMSKWGDNKALGQTTDCNGSGCANIADADDTTSYNHVTFFSTDGEFDNTLYQVTFASTSVDTVAFDCDYSYSINDLGGGGAGQVSHDLHIELNISSTWTSVFNEASTNDIPLCDNGKKIVTGSWSNVTGVRLKINSNADSGFGPDTFNSSIDVKEVWAIDR